MAFVTGGASLQKKAHSRFPNMHIRPYFNDLGAYLRRLWFNPSDFEHALRPALMMACGAWAGE